MSEHAVFSYPYVVLVKATTEVKRTTVRVNFAEFVTVSELRVSGGPFDFFTGCLYLNVLPVFYSWNSVWVFTGFVVRFTGIGTKNRAFIVSSNCNTPPGWKTLITQKSGESALTDSPPSSRRLSYCWLLLLLLLLRTAALRF